MLKPDILFFTSPDALYTAAADYFIETAIRSVRDYGRFSVALSGGSTPGNMFDILATPPCVNRVSWENIYVFFEDDRYVPLDDPDSNYRLAESRLLSKVAIPADHVFRIPTESVDIDHAAAAYEKTIREFFDESATRQAGIPRFDLIIGGMGSDGHTASLFIGDPAVDEKNKLVAAVHHPGQPPFHKRVTMTFPLINAAKQVMMLVSGEAKRAIAEQVFRFPDLAGDTYPAARIQPAGGLSWFVHFDIPPKMPHA